MSDDSRRIFTVKINDEDVEFYIRDPSIKDVENARAIYVDKYNKLVAANGIFRSVLEKKMKDSGLWTDENEIEYTSLQEELKDKVNQILNGGIKLSVAKQYAIRVREIRDKMREMKREVAAQTDSTIEGQATNAEFNSLLVSCLVYNNDRNKRYFNTVDDYLASTNDPVAIIGAVKFTYLHYGIGLNDEDLPENQFLKRFNFIDDSLRLIDENGRLISDDGKYIDELGRYIKYITDEEGKESTIFVDINGHEVDENGKYKFDKIEYLE